MRRTLLLAGLSCAFALVMSGCKNNGNPDVGEDIGEMRVDQPVLAARHAPPTPRRVEAVPAPAPITTRTERRLEPKKALKASPTVAKAQKRDTQKIGELDSD
jgi:hypothetical protein